jgi:pilus assembly protein TadC
MDDAQRLGSALATSWQEAYGPSLIEIPMSIVASLALAVVIGLYGVVLGFIIVRLYDD